MRELGEGGAGGDERGAAVRLVADVLEDVVPNLDGEARLVAARRVPRLADTARRFELSDVAGPYEVFYDFRVVGFGHQASGFGWSAWSGHRASTALIFVT